MSRTAIANNALRHIRNSKTLTDVDTDTSVQAVAIQAFLDDAISELARAKEWPPLRKVAALALVREGDPDTGDERLYYYRWPADCEKARYIVDGLLKPSRIFPRIEFEIYSDVTGKLIATDEAEAYLCYTKEMVDVDQMSAKWKRALEWKIAELIAPTLAGDQGVSMVQLCLAMYEKNVDEAWAEYLNERSRGASPEAEEIEGR